MTAILNCIETAIDEEKNILSSFIIEPLEAGQGITLGNSLRRTLLSDLTGFAITGVRINNLKHEFSVIDGIREDVLEILLNLKEVVFKPSLILKNKSFLSISKTLETITNSDLSNNNLEKNEKENVEKSEIEEKQDINNVPLKFKAFISVKGPMMVTAGLFFLPKNAFQIVNPEQYICTILDDSELYLEVDIENGVGYQLIDESRKKNINEKMSLLKPTTLLVDSIFMPVKKVNYKIKLIHDSYGNIKESLSLEILTNGSISPKRSLYEAIMVLINLFYPLLITPQLLAISSAL